MKNNCPACLKIKQNLSFGSWFWIWTSTLLNMQNAQLLYKLSNSMPSLKKVSSFYPENYHSFESLGILKEIRSWMRLQGLRKFIYKNDKILILVVVMEIFIFCIKIFSNCTFMDTKLQKIRKLNTIREINYY